MHYEAYQALFDKVLSDAAPVYPYDSAFYIEYTKLNRSRMKRWDKQLVLSEELRKVLAGMDKPLHWIIITEPWCGDAAHIVPFVVQMVALNPLFSYELQLRDSVPFLIESYLTDGSKSIPKVVVRDEAGKDLFVWGPRPEPAQELYLRLKAEQADFETAKVALQQWYNEDKGVTLCQEFAALLRPLGTELKH